MWLFLDIDGVLLPEKCYPTVADPDAVLEAYAHPRLNSACLQQLARVIDRYPQLKIAISSSWREMFPFEHIRSLFPPEIQAKIVGATPFLPPQRIYETRYVRYEEILEFLRGQQAEQEPWVAVDDLPTHFPPDAPVIATDSYEGLDAIAADRLMDYLAAQLEPGRE